MTETDVATNRSFTQDQVQRGAKSLQFATFYLGSELFGINILQVQEILLNQRITPVPLASEYILGLIGLRGLIVTAVDLKRRLGLSQGETVEEPYQIVVTSNDSIASLQVDRIGDVLEIDVNQLQPPPNSLKDIDTRFLEGITMLNNEILAVLNISAVLEVN